MVAANDILSSCHEVNCQAIQSHSRKEGPGCDLLSCRKALKRKFKHLFGFHTLVAAHPVQHGLGNFLRAITAHLRRSRRICIAQPYTAHISYVTLQ